MTCLISDLVSWSVTGCKVCAEATGVRPPLKITLGFLESFRISERDGVDDWACPTCPLDDLTIPGAPIPDRFFLLTYVNYYINLRAVSTFLIFLVLP